LSFSLRFACFIFALFAWNKQIRAKAAKDFHAKMSLAVENPHERAVARMRKYLLNLNLNLNLKEKVHPKKKSRVIAKGVMNILYL